MDIIKEQWHEIKENIRKEFNITSISYSTWIEPLQFHKVENNNVTIIIPSDKAHALNYISDKYKNFFHVIIY